MSIKDLTIGNAAPEIVTAVIEIPKGSHHKYEYDDTLDLIRLDRVIHSPVHYPTDYGFIPGTLSEDGDHLDVLALISEPLFPGCVVDVRPVGALDITDDKGRDWKIVAVACGDPRLSKIQNIGDLDEHYKMEIEHFFREYKKLEGKAVTVDTWVDKPTAYNLITAAVVEFNKTV